MINCIVSYRIVLNGIVSYHIISNCIVSYCNLMYCILMYRIVAYRSVSHRSILHRNVWHCIILCCIALHCIILYNTYCSRWWILQSLMHVVWNMWNNAVIVICFCHYILLFFFFCYAAENPAEMGQANSIVYSEVWKCKDQSQDTTYFTWNINELYYDLIGYLSIVLLF